MKKMLMLVALLCICSSLLSRYAVGDVVEDFTFQDTNLDAQGNVVTYDRSIKNLIEVEKKLVFINFFFPT